MPVAIMSTAWSTAVSSRPGSSLRRAPDSSTLRPASSCSVSSCSSRAQRRRSCSEACMTAPQRIVRRGLRGRDGGRCARGERLQQPLVLLGERAVPADPVERAEDPDRAVAEDHRGHERASARRACARANDSSGSSASRCDRPLRNAIPATEPSTGSRWPRSSCTPSPRAGGDHELVALEQRELDDARLDQRARALRDELEHPVEVRDAAERARDLRRRLEAAVRALELVAALADVAVQPGVVDRDRRPVGEDDGRVLVLLGELADRLLGQVEVAPHLAADDDRHAEEGVHRRMRQREPVRLGVRADVGQSQRLRVVDQHPEHAAPMREVADRAVRLLVDALGEELVEQLAPLVEHADRGVPRAGQLLGEVEQPIEHRVGIQLGHDGPPDVQETAKS